MFNEKEYYKQYYQNNKERIRKKNDEYLKNHPNYTKKYRQKNKEKILKQRKEYYQKNKQYFKKHGKEYRQKNKKKLLKWRKEYERKNRQKIRVAFLNYLQKNRETWKGYIPKKTNCQICDKKIYFKQSKKQYNKEDVIHFDHRNKNSLIKRNPTSWLSIHPRTPKNQKIWGIL